ncbi:olfactory receptor 2A14-like [Engystomops pustulosus]|uniref:olfactory receptor 2A14-like n=1 Tax=Engystomops pustulosus TaxID=76066 RepID=UPI003AFAC618
MDNRTCVEFLVVPFSTTTNKFVIVTVFSSIYSIGVLVNLLIFVVISFDIRLHSPMYVFLCNLSFIDICYTTVIIPKLLHIVHSGMKSLSFKQCFTQMYFHFTTVTAEVTLFFAMGYDRYIAICHPLYYHQILSKKICILIIVVIWVCAFLNSLFIISPLLSLPFQEAITVHHLFCHAVDVVNAFHGGSPKFTIVIFVECALFGLGPLSCNFLSYIKIIRVILCIKSKEGRRKTFSTCLSHLIVMMIYYSTGCLVYLIPMSEHTVTLSQTLSVFYNIVVPMIHPLVYSLRNSEIKRACRRFLKI